VSSLKVICPKCFKGQQITGSVPTAGLDHVCVFCKTTFRVRPPARPSSDDLPVPRELQPKPGDLPAPREAIPKPGDLPAPREAIPRPGDLPVAREAVPRPGDLPVAREAVPRPGDLPVAREAVPKPQPVPKPASLPNVQAPRMPVAHPERTPTKTPPLGLALDLSLSPEIPAGGLSLSLDLPPIPPAPIQAKPLVPSAPPLPSAEKKPPASPVKPPPIPARPPLGSPPVPRSGTMPLPSLASLESEPPSIDLGFKQDAPIEPAAPSQTLSSLDLDLGPARTPLPVRTSGAKEGAAGKGLDLGFSLELEGDAQERSAAPAALPFPAARVASEGMGESAAAAGDELPTLAPPTARGVSAARALRPVAKKGGVPKWLFFVAGGLALAAVAVGVSLPLLRTAPSPDTVLKPFATEINNDNVPSYQQSAERLIAVAAEYKETGARLRLRAAELLLTAQVAHGGVAVELPKIEQMIDSGVGQPKLAAAMSRARALLAIA